ncbi:MAG: class I SAM-dependent methyltransferase [Deltaproteobacteria bacterium]|nr:MAG: class I SAM-dependent methyltransferase [Deltaproteobacteria bacterium]
MRYTRAVTTARFRRPAPAPRAQARPLHAQEMFGARAMRRIVRALPPIESAYAAIRFTIMRSKLLSVMDLLLPAEGRILDVGCGFGLFAAYFAQTQPQRRLTGIDTNARRIDIARSVMAKLELTGHELLVGDARAVRDIAGAGFQAIYVLDVLHHVPRDDQEALLACLYDLLEPGGVLVLKDITTEPWIGLKFTELLDRVMVGWDEPLAYRHHREWGEMLSSLGFHVRMVRVPDVLPYPHVVIAATKQ